MESFFRLYQQMQVEKSSEGYVRRLLMDAINEDNRLVCIRGQRGVGKTRFLLDYAEEKFSGKVVLYTSLNYFYFSLNSLYSFATTFVQQYGGEVLLLDQIYKYPNWIDELGRIHRDFPKLTILFTTSSVMTSQDDFSRLGTELVVYDLPGFSFREYLNSRTGLKFDPIPLEQIFSEPMVCVHRVLQELQPCQFLAGYNLGSGYYPSSADKGSTQAYSRREERLIKHLNMLLEVDVVYIRQIGPGYVSKLRQLLYTLAIESKDSKHNISKLSEQLGISRATVMNYIKYLSDAGLVLTLYKDKGDCSDLSRKPDSFYIGNPNILGALILDEPSEKSVMTSFLLSHLIHSNVSVSLTNSSRYSDSFLVGNSRTLIIEESEHRRYGARDTYYVVNKIAQVDESEIPLWLFGFLY